MRQQLRILRKRIFHRPAAKCFLRKLTGLRIDEASDAPKLEHKTLYKVFCNLLTQGGERKLNFVQVGANDGVNDDPINSLVHQFGKKALLNEPQPWLIDNLKEAYKNFKGELFVKNCAAGSTTGNLNLFYLKNNFWELYFQKVGRKADQLVSSNKQQIVSRLIPRLGLKDDEVDAYIDVLDVPVFTVEDLVRTHEFGEIDVLQVDCEGYDVEVLLGLNNLRPKIINIEFFNLSNSDILRYYAWCELNSYVPIVCGQDAFCVHISP